MNNKNSKYYILRAEQRMHHAHDEATVVVQAINEHYSKSLKSLQDDIDRIFKRLEKQSSYDNTLEYLSEDIPNDEYERLLDLFKTTKDKQVRKELKARLNAQAAKYRISRKEAILESINRMRLSNVDYQLQKGNEHLKDTFFDAFSSKLKDSGFKDEMIGISAQHIREVINNKWSGDNYSGRVWKNQNELANRAKELVLRHIETGTPTKKLTDELMDLTDLGKYASNRLLRTETSYIVNMADYESAKRLGVEYRKFVATLDVRTSEQCREHNGDIIALKDTKIGVNTPPLHPYCRSVMIDIIPGLNDDILPQNKKEILKDLKEYYGEHDSSDGLKILKFKSNVINPVVNSDEIVNKYYKFIKFQTKDNKIHQLVKESLKIMPEQDLKYLLNTDVVIKEDYHKSRKGGYRQEVKLFNLITINKPTIFINPNKASSTTFAHELVHDITYKNKLFKSKEVQNLIDIVLNDASLKSIDYKGKKELFVVSEKLLTKYQGRTYLLPGEENKFNYSSMREFLTVSYQEYLENPQYLHDKFIEMYNYFKGGWIK